jgi:hypothetical protein
MLSQVVNLDGKLDNNNQVQLGWKYLSNSASFFEVEKWDSIARVWKKINKMYSNANVKLSNEYHCIDLVPVSGSNLYRLKIINKDGTYSYSNVAQVVNQLNSLEAFRIYPNPVVGKSVFTIDLGRAFNGYNNTYQITDLGGKQLRSGRLTQAITAISTAGLSAGSYIVTVNNAYSHVMVLK